MKKVVTVVGARPQFIKAAPVSRAFARSSVAREIILHSGQHFDDDMSRIFFEQLGIPQPTHNLAVSGGGHGQMTGRMLEGTERFLIEQQADAVLVYGDTNSTLAGALAAAKLHIPVIHVEAGLRSFNRAMPEEINRIMTDHVSTLLCTPTASALRQLAIEGFNGFVADGGLVEAPLAPDLRLDRSARHVAWTGDVMYDAIQIFRERSMCESRILDQLGLVPGAYVVATVHRAENTSDAADLGIILSELGRLADMLPVVLPAHPRTRALIAQGGFDTVLARHRGLKVISPLSYLDFLRIQASARAIVTDSGGVQKEAMFLGVPCVTLRDETEWEESIESGWNRLAGKLPKGLAEIVQGVVKPATDPPSQFGRGHAADTIVALTEALLIA